MGTLPFSRSSTSSIMSHLIFYIFLSVAPSWTLNPSLYSDFVLFTLLPLLFLSQVHFPPPLSLSLVNFRSGVIYCRSRGSTYSVMLFPPCHIFSTLFFTQDDSLAFSGTHMLSPFFPLLTLFIDSFHSATWLKHHNTDMTLKPFLSSVLF